MFRRTVSRPRSTCTALGTSAALVAATLLVAPDTAPGAAAPDAAPDARPSSTQADGTRALPTAVAQRPVTPKVREVRIPDKAAPRTMSAQGAHGARRVVAATGLRDTAPYSMLGVVWDSGPGTEDVEIEVRVRDDDGWTDWQHLERSEDGPVAVDDEQWTAPLWVGRADGVQARALSERGGAPRGLRISLIDPGATGTSTRPALDVSTDSIGSISAVPASHRDVSKPAIISRPRWGADESLRERCDNGLHTRTVDVTFVHHTAGSNSYAKSESDDLVRGIYAYHTRSLGWCDIGYNFLVDKYGQIFMGRYGGSNGAWKPVYGAHTGGYNDNSAGISLMGNFENARPTKAMKNATVRIVAWKLAVNYRHPKGHATINGKRFKNISGHRDAKATACPGRTVYDWLPSLRNRVDNRIAPYQTRIFDKWTKMGRKSGIAKVPYWGERHRSGGTVAWFRGADILQKSGLGTHAVHGAIRKRYRGLGVQNGKLGFPRTDEIAAAKAGARQNKFAHGRIYWHKRTGAREIYGGILRRYLRIGGTGSPLGMPTTGERDAAKAGSRLNKFQHGRIYWHKATGAHSVLAGAISRRYLRMGGTTSRLGMPTTERYDVSGGRAQKFQGGRIRWDRSSNTTSVTFN